MAEIISALEANTKVDISVTQGKTQDNVLAETRSPKLHRFQDPDHVVFESKFLVEIRIDETLVKSASAEGLSAAIVHEVLHAYMNYNNKDYNNQFAQHTTISEKYIQTLSSFLISKFNIPTVDAYALTWHGVEDTKLFQQTETFKIGNEEIPKRDMQHIAGQYAGGIDDKPGKGTPLCDKQ